MLVSSTLPWWFSPRWWIPGDQGDGDDFDEDGNGDMNVDNDGENK